MASITRDSVEPIDAIGDPPAPARFLAGTELSPRGQQWYESLGEPSRSMFIKSIGPDAIRDAWVDHDQLAGRYSVAYLLLAAGFVLLLGASGVGGEGREAGRVTGSGEPDDTETPLPAGSGSNTAP